MHESGSAHQRSCTPRAASRAGDVSLSVLPPSPDDAAAQAHSKHRGGRNAWQSGHPTIAHSKAGKWRAAVLILVHVLIIAHVIHWLLTGMTLSPVEPSESMQTLREGAVNAGFVMFLLAIASTALLGRWFCGWACHVVALQDLSAWAMMKLGVKPKPFRSRLLLWAPLGVAIYMFIWPVFHREVLRPLLGDQWGRLPVWLGQSDPLPTIRTEFLVEDFWATFPAWYTAIPFFLVIGFACVYFLGSKGFCTYGCPYGGFFVPVDRLALGRIRVNDDCNQCGHCTAVCTSNVRVHEEVRDFGTVMDPGCMKCMDCVSVCPNDALRFGVGAPAVLTKPKDANAKERAAKARALREARYDLTRPEEWVFALVFLVILQSFRGFLNEVPLLMAVGIAGVGTFLVHKCWRLLRDPSVRLVNQQLKAKGVMRAAGWATIVATLVFLAVGAWSAFVRWHTWRASELYARMTVPLNAVFRPEFEASASQRQIAQRMTGHLRTADRFGWGLNPEQRVNLAYGLCVLDDLHAAEAEFMRVLHAGNPHDNLVFELVQVKQMLGRDRAEVRTMMEQALTEHPRLDGVRAALAAELAAAEPTPDNPAARDRAVAMWDAPLARKHVQASTYVAAARTMLQARQPDRAFELLDKAVQIALEHHDAESLMTAAQLRTAAGQPDQARPLVEDALRVPTNRGHRAIAAAGLFTQFGDAERASALAADATDRAERLGPHSGQAGVFVSAAQLMAQQGKLDEALKLYTRATQAVGYSAWDLGSIGQAMAQTAQAAGGVEAMNETPRGKAVRGLLDGAVSALERACEIEPDASTLQHDLAQVYLFSGQTDKAVATLELAANTGAANPELAGRMAQLLSYLGRNEQAARWVEEARRRDAAMLERDRAREPKPLTSGTR